MALTPVLHRLATLAILVTYIAASPSLARDAVADWTITADRLGHGNANWRTLAIMHQAMHDAVNAAEPTYARWHPADANEPQVTSGLPRKVVAMAALAAAARRVLILLHPDDRNEIERTYARALARTPDGPAEDAGVALGEVIGKSAVRRRTNDGFGQVHLFPTSPERGGWQLAPKEFRNSSTTDIGPFLFSSAAEVPAPPPFAATDPRLRAELEQVRDIGGLQSALRTPLQSEAASYWYFQSSQRGFVYLGLALLEARAASLSLATEARIMSQLVTAMADSAILIWWEKEHFLSWRPVTAIHEEIPGVASDPDWMPMIETPPHPEYPSGHASDCFTGAMVLQATFPNLAGPVSYVAQPGRPPEGITMGMGQHSKLADSGIRAKRTYQNLAAMAEDRAESRIWAGAHFRAAVTEAKRVAQLISHRALAAVPSAPKAGRADRGLEQPKQRGEAITKRSS